MPHDQCPTSRRGHTWREPRPALLPEVPRRDLLAMRVCARCGALGLVNKQGVVVVTSIQEFKDAQLRKEDP
jgi:hypothetical protein